MIPPGARVATISPLRFLHTGFGRIGTTNTRFFCIIRESLDASGKSECNGGCLFDRTNSFVLNKFEINGQIIIQRISVVNW